MRVFITGIGIQSCLGAAAEFERRLFAGECGLAPGPDGFLAGRVRGLETEPGESRLAAMARTAGLEALGAGAGLDPERSGIFISCSKGGMEAFGDAPPEAGPWLGRLAGHYPGAALRCRLGWQGGGGNYPLACATGAYSLGAAYEAMQQGRLDAALAGAAEASLTPLMAAGFEGLGALARASSLGELRGAFDRGRKGFIMGEGAAVLLLETEASARRRGARPIAEFLGWSLSADAYHMTAPEPSGSQAARALRHALLKAGLGPEALGYLNAHGTGTRLGDAAESRALAAVFGTGGPRVSGIKAATGHLLGASGALEAAATALALKRREAPPQLFTAEPEPDMRPRLALGKGLALAAGPAFAASLSMGFGGHNLALVLGGMDGDPPAKA